MQTNRFFSTARRWALRLALLALLLVLDAPAAAPVAVAKSAPPLLQFTAGGHVIGFAPTQVILAAFDHALRVEFVGTNGVTPAAVGAETASSSDAPTLGGAQPLGIVTYPELWRGVSVEYRASDAGILKSTYTLAPGADVAQIRLRYNVPVELQSDGSLQFAFGRGVISESAPLAWQEIDGARVPVQVAFQTSGVLETSQVYVGFHVGAYDARYPLTIDPDYIWHTFYGSTAYDMGYGIALDGSGNVYLAGSSRSTWQGDGNANPLHAHSGGQYDIVVVKLNGAGAYQWHTFYGSTDYDHGYGIAVDVNGNIYVAGTSYATWSSGPGGVGGTAPLHAHSGGQDIVVMKLNSAGTYQWHTFYGSSSYDVGWEIEEDGNGILYIVGTSLASWSSGPGGVGGTAPLHAHSGGNDICVLKLTGAGAYQWHTFYGSSDNEHGRQIAVSGSGYVYITGYSHSTWQGDGNANPLHAHNGLDDIFALKLNSAGGYQWHTFYGSSASDYGYGIDLDGSDNVYITGTSSATWSTGPGGVGGTAPLHAHSGGSDICVLKLNSAGGYQWHTFYGSTYSDEGNAIVVDGSGNLLIAGYSFDSWQGDGNADPHHAYSGGYDIVALKLTSAGGYQWHTFYGSSDEDQSRGITVDGSGNVYITGWSQATWQGDRNANPLHAHSGSRDIIALKLRSLKFMYLPLILKGN